MRSPLNEGHDKKTDSIAAANAWKEFKKGYMDRTNKTPEENEKEYNMEKNEFYYDTTRGKLRLIPTDDGEVQDRSGIEKWQLAPSMKTPMKREKKRGEAGFQQDPQEAMFERMSDQMDRQKETDSKPLSKEESKRLHAVSSINYDKVVSSGGVDLGIIKNKNK